jgi:CreA protein
LNYASSSRSEADEAGHYPHRNRNLSLPVKVSKRSEPLRKCERGTTGAVSTKFRLLGPNDKIVIDGFDDPKVDGVACHISRAQTGGMKGAFGVAEDTSDASIACRQVGPIKIKGEIEDGERVFDERRSLLLKTLQVVRFFDKQRNVLVYVAYSDRVIEGSPKNSISSVPIMSWPEP